jgi:hypothetical protein
VQRELAARGGGPADHDVQFDIVAHSMGGLIARYYLMYGDAELPDEGPLPQPTWAGARYVDRAILVGTPNAGSAGAVHNLVEGADFAFFLPRYDAAVLGTMPSLYQLMPRGRHGALVSQGDTSRHLDPLDIDLWTRMEWGLADPAQDRVLQKLLPDVRDHSARRAIALDHLAKCLDRARRFTAALDVPATAPEGVELHLFAGDAKDTPAVLAVGDDGKLRVHARRPGDGTVLRSSAVMDERVGGQWARGVRTPVAWRRTSFLFTDHLGLTRDPAFADNVLYILLEEPRGAATAFEQELSLETR